MVFRKGIPSQNKFLI